MANTCVTSGDTFPRQSAQSRWKQGITFAQMLKNVEIPVHSAQPLGGQTDQVWEQIRPGSSRG